MHNEFDNRFPGRSQNQILKNNLERNQQLGNSNNRPNLGPQIAGPSAPVAAVDEKIGELEKVQTFFNSQLEEAVKTFKLRMDRMQLHVTKMEQHMNGLNMDWSQKIHHIQIKVNEQKKYDQKVQELMDRHANLIKSYEVRIQHLTKLLNEKEAQCIQTHAVLNEARMEISRLKRL